MQKKKKKKKKKKARNLANLIRFFGKYLAVSRSKILFRLTGFPVNRIPDKRFRTEVSKFFLENNHENIKEFNTKEKKFT